MAENSERLPRNVEWEVARIRKFPSTVEDSVAFEMRDDAAAITFQIRTDPLLDGEKAASIDDVEQICFAYASPEQIGKTAPVTLSDRKSFPRNLSHLNPGAKELPASLCLSRTSIQAIYDRFGIVGVLDRLSSWLSDAKSGVLYDDGWEPVPTPPLDSGAVGLIDPKKFQMLAAEYPSGGFRFISAGVRHLKSGGLSIDALQPFLDTGDSESLQRAKSEMSQMTGDQTAIPAIFCWPDSETQQHEPHFNQWTDISALVNGLKETALWDHVDEATIRMDVLFNEQDGSAKRADLLVKKQKRGILLIVGLWRPKPIDRSIGGLAEDDDLARSLELRALFVSRDAEKSDPWDSLGSVEQFLALTPANSETLSAVSGEAPLEDLLVLGAGALGSNLIDHAARSGTGRVHVIDEDVFLPHNTARHIGSRFAVGERKAEISAEYAMAANCDISVTHERKDILSLSDEHLGRQIEASHMVIDATANAQVRVKISRKGLPKSSVVRTEIFNRGLLGVTLATETDSDMSTNFLYHWLISQAPSHAAVKDWIAYEATSDFRDQELLLGFGCHSLTTKLPNYKLSGHAAAAYAAARSHQHSADKRPAVYLNQIDNNGLSCGSSVLRPEKVTVFDDENDTDGWRVIVAEQVLNRMHSLRAEKAPNETGGYLYGAICEPNSEIYVLFISAEPPGTVGSPAHLALGPCGWTGQEKAFLRRTRQRLSPIGTWHSHPNGAPTASSKDWTTIEGFLDKDSTHGIPTFMLISGADSDRAYVKSLRA